MVPTTLVVLVVVPHEGRYLIVQERDGTFYLPAGRVEARESLVAAAIRETAEEAGVRIAVRGILAFDHEWRLEARMRMRFVLVGDVTTLAPTKSRPDEHSRGAAWRTRQELTSLPLRHPEVVKWIDRYERAPSLLPCTAYEAFGTH